MFWFWDAGRDSFNRPSHAVRKHAIWATVGSNADGKCVSDTNSSRKLFFFISKLYLASVVKLRILRVAEPFEGSQTLIPSVD